MSYTSTAGDNIAFDLNPYIGTTNKIRETAKQLAVAADKYNRIQETWCNGILSEGEQRLPADVMDNLQEMRAKALEIKETKLTARIMSLVLDLPEPEHDGQRYKWGVTFEGDPRGHTVKLHFNPVPGQGMRTFAHTSRLEAGGYVGLDGRGKRP